METEDDLPTGMTTSSRASSLLSNAIIDASVMLKDDLSKRSLEQLKGRVYKGKFICDWTVKPGPLLKTCNSLFLWICYTSGYPR